MGSSVVEFIIVSDYDNDGSERGQSPAPSDDVSSRESSAEPEPVPTNGRSERPPTSTPVEGSRKPRSSEEALRHSGRLADPGYKSFACSICSESFNFKFELLRHKMSHYEKPKKTRLPSVNDRWRIKFKKHRVQKKRKPGKRASSARKKSLDDPMFLTPLELGWTRLAVHRSSDPKKCDIYYKNPDGRKFRSVNELSTVKLTNGLSLDHFTFRRCPLNLLHPREIVCNARPQAATSSPQAPKTKISPPPQVPAKTATPQNGMIRETPQTSVQKSPTKKEITPKTKTTPTPKAPSKFYPKASSSQSDDGTDQKFLLPLNNGWTRLVVGRPKNKGYDVCYMNSEGQKFRSLSDMRRQKFKKGIALENFTFKRCPLDLKHPNEILKTSGSSSVKKELPKAKNSPGPHKVPTKKENVGRALSNTRTPSKFRRSPIVTRKNWTPNPKLIDTVDSATKNVRRALSNTRTPSKFRRSPIVKRNNWTPNPKLFDTENVRRALSNTNTPSKFRRSPIVTRKNWTPDPKLFDTVDSKTKNVRRDLLNTRTPSKFRHSPIVTRKMRTPNPKLFETVDSATKNVRRALSNTNTPSKFRHSPIVTRKNWTPNPKLFDTVYSTTKNVGRALPNTRTPSKFRRSPIVTRKNRTPNPKLFDTVDSTTKNVRRALSNTRTTPSKFRRSPIVTRKHWTPNPKLFDTVDSATKNVRRSLSNTRTPSKFRRSPTVTRKNWTPNPKLFDTVDSATKVASVRRPLKDTPRSPFKAKSSPIDTRKKDTSKPKMYKITKTLSIVKKAETSNAKKTIDDQLYLPPLNQGWSRLVVFRQKNKIQCDVYYVNPAGKKFRSMKELERGLLDDKRVKGLSIENFTFVRRALNLDHPKQVIQKSGARQRGQMMESSPVHALRPLTTLVQKRRPPVRRGVRTNSDPKLSFLSQLDLDSTELQPRVVLEDIMLTKSSERRASLTASEEPVNGCCDTQSADGDEISSQSESNSLRNEDNEAATSEEETTQQMITDEDNEGATSELGQNQHQEDVTSNLETHNVDELPDIHGDTPGWADEKTPDADEEIPDESTADEKPPDENNTNEEIPDENTAAEKTRDESNIGEKIPDENPDEEMPDERKTDEQIPVGNNTEGNILDGNNTEGKILDGNNTEEEIPESKDPVECEPCETLELPDDPAENLDKSEETPSEFKSPDEDNKTYKEGNSADDALVHQEVQADFTGDSEGLCMELSSIPDFPSHAEDKGSISIEDLVDADDVLWVSQPDPERT